MNTTPCSMLVGGLLASDPGSTLFLIFRYQRQALDWTCTQEYEGGDE